jgi:hypothetical protein
MGRGAAHMEKLLMSHCHLRPSCLKVEADASAPAFTLAATETASTTTMIQRYFQMFENSVLNQHWMTKLHVKMKMAYNTLNPVVLVWLCHKHHKETFGPLRECGRNEQLPI